MSGPGPVTAVRVVLFGHEIVHKVVHFLLRARFSRALARRTSALGCRPVALKRRYDGTSETETAYNTAHVCRWRAADDDDDDDDLFPVPGDDG